MTDWTEWSRQAVAAMSARNEACTFGITYDLPLLTEPEWPGGRAEGLEMLAIAGQVQDASGGFINGVGELVFFFTLHRFRTRPHPGVAGRAAG